MLTQGKFKNTALHKTLIGHDGTASITHSTHYTPEASFLMYWLSAELSWLEFSRARQTFLMCVGISSMIPGSQSGGMLALLSGNGDAEHWARAKIATKTVTITTWSCIFLVCNEMEKKIKSELLMSFLQRCDYENIFMVITRAESAGWTLCDLFLKLFRWKFFDVFARRIKIEFVDFSVIRISVGRESTSTRCESIKAQSR